MKMTARVSFAPAQIFVIAVACASSKVPTVENKPVKEAPAALSQAELRGRVRALLSKPDAGEPDWKQLGPGAMPVLEQVIHDPSFPSAQRARAVEALARVDNAEADAKLQSIARDAKVGAQYRSLAVGALAERDGPAAAQPIKQILSDPNRQVREQAIRALAHVGGEEARKALEERLPKEEDPSLRELIQRSLTRMQP